MDNETTPKRWFTRKEAAAYLNVHPLTILRHEKQGLIKAYRLGGRTLYDIADLDAAVEIKTACIR